MQQPRVTELWIYPIKSCRGISVRHLEIDALGPKYDRQWMIVDSNNHFLTLRNCPQLSGIQTSIDHQNLNIKFGSHQFSISLTAESSIVESVTVWSDTFLAGVESIEINSALSQFLNQNVKLVRYQQESFRDLKSAGTEAVAQFKFADSRPLLLTNKESLADLNSKLVHLNLAPSMMERFRSNIIISGLQAFGEDLAMEMQIGNIDLKNPKFCARCPIITQDVQTGKVVSKETLTTLASYRRLSGSKVMFGVNWTPANAGTIRVNDSVNSKLP